MTRLAVICVVLACGGPRKGGDTRPAPGDLDLDRQPAPTTSGPPPPSSSLPAPESPLPIEHAPRFRGRLIDIDVKDADLHNVFRLIADAGGVSIAVADDVKGTITLRLRRIPWDQALDAVVRLEKLHLERQGDVYLVTR